MKQLYSRLSLLVLTTLLMFSWHAMAHEPPDYSAVTMADCTELTERMPCTPTLDTVKITDLTEMTALLPGTPAGDVDKWVVLRQDTRHTTDGGTEPANDNEYSTYQIAMTTANAVGGECGDSCYIRS